MAKASYNRKKAVFTSKWDLKIQGRTKWIAAFRV
jgi:hypothetical protein